MIKDKKHDYNIATVSERVKELTTNSTQTSFTTLYLEKTVLLFGNVGALNLLQITNVQKLKDMLMLI